MADPVGLTASIIGLIQATLTIIQYVNDVRGGPKEKRKLAQELGDLLQMLQGLKYNDEERDKALNEPGNAHGRSLAIDLTRLEEKMREIAVKLQPEVSRLKKLGKALSWPFDKVEIEAVLAAIERVKTNIIIALNLEQERISQQINADTSLLSGIDTSIKTTEAKQAQEDIRATIEWLSPLDPYGDQQAHLVRWQHGTGDWFLHSSQYVQFKRSTGGKLWCNGIPGAGKTVLAALAAQDLYDTYTSDETVKVAVMFCDHRFRDVQSIQNMVTAIWRQVIDDEHSLSKDVEKMRKEFLKKGSLPSMIRIIDALQDAVSKLSRTFVILDGFDECRQDVGNEFLDILLALTPQINLLVMSRPFEHIGKLFHLTPSIPIRARNEDVQNYLKARIRAESRLSLLIRKDTELESIIVTRIVEKVNGMFLLARLHVDSLVLKTTSKQVRKVLMDLSGDLGAAYDAAFARIKDQGEDDRKLAMRVLSWIAFAHRPLTLQEIQYAFAIEDDDEDDIDPLNITDEDIISASCQGLVLIDKNNSIVRLVHETATVYLQNTRDEKFPDAQFDLMRTCIAALKLKIYVGQARTEGKIDVSLNRDAYIDYSALYWGDHARAAGCEMVQDEIFDFMTKYRKNLTFALQLLLRNTDQTFKQGRKMRSSIMRDFEGGELLSKDSVQVDHASPLNVAAYFGLDCLVEKMLTAEPSTDLFKFLGHEAFQALRDKHAGHDKRDNFCRNPLFLSDDHYFGTALHWAALGDHESVMTTLLADKCAPRILESVNAYGETALTVAARRGNTTSAELLLKAGADGASRGHWNDLNSRYWTPLHYAVLNDHFDLVKVLVSSPQKMRIMMQGNHLSKIPLHDAAERNKLVSVKILLESGQPLTAQTNDGDTSLHWAARNGFNEMISLLLKYDCKNELLEMKNKKGETALMVAAETYQSKAVEFLAGKGADIHTQDSGGLTALSHAAIMGDINTLELLLKLDTSNKFSSMPEGLQAAVQHAAYTNQGALEFLTKLGGPKLQRVKTDLSTVFLPATTSEVFHVAFLIESAFAQHSKSKTNLIVNRIVCMAQCWVHFETSSSLQYTCTQDTEPAAYVKSQPIIGRPVSPVQELSFTVTSHDQGFSNDHHLHGTYLGSHTWFDAVIIRGDEMLYGPNIAYNLHARKVANTRTTVWDLERTAKGNTSSEETVTWMKGIRVGDVVGIVPRARYPAWTNYVLSAKLVVKTSCFKEFE